MRIVALGLRGFPNVQGGVEVHCENLYPRLVAAGHEVIAICRKPYMPSPPSHYKGVRLKILACPRQRSLEAVVHSFLAVIHARLMNPDVLHIHAIGPSLMVPLARLLGMRVVSTNHGADYDRQKWSRIPKAVLRFGERVGTLFSNEVIAISRPIADHLHEHYGRRPEIIPNGVVIRPAPAARDVLRRFALSEGKFLLAVGRLVPEKGFHDLIRAFGDDRGDLQLVIAGAADHEDAYAIGLNKIASANPSVRMIGFVGSDDLAQLYACARAFVLPSYHEGLPIALLEAMSHGLPVVASDIPGNREVGLTESSYFPAGDLPRLRRALDQVLNEPFSPQERRSQIETVSRRFEWAEIARRTERLFLAQLPNAPGDALLAGPSDASLGD